MIEVEGKISVSNINKIENMVKRIADYKGTEKKVDDYYTLEQLNHYPHKSLRIRKRKGFYEVNFKKSLSFKNGVHAKKEVEFKINDYDGFLNLIQDFGFKKDLRKEKMTKLYEIKPNFHIELNHVRGLGWFLEIEYLSDEKGIEKARNEVLRIVKILGYKEKDLIKSGYTKMLWGKKN